MPKIKTSELIDFALDWAVAKTTGYKPHVFVEKDCGQGAFRPLSRWCGVDVTPDGHTVYSPSTNWTQGGPIIERERIAIKPFKDGGEWLAKLRTHQHDGPTPLIAAMRCFVASKLGNEVNIPAELKD
jgi:hypothetical protein